MPNTESRNLFLAVSAVMVSIALFTSMDATIKWLGAKYPVHQLMFFRTTVAFVPVLIILIKAGGFRVLKTKRAGLHGLRSVVGMCAMLCAFFGFTTLPLADASSVFYTAPLLATAFSVPLLKEKVGPRRWFAIVVGLFGVMIIIRPGGNVFNLGGLAMFAAAVLVGLTSNIVRKLNATDEAISITFYFTLSGAVVTSISCLFFGWVVPDPADIPLLLCIGLLGGCAQYALTLSFRHGEVGIIAPFKYMSIIIGTALGYLIWSEIPDQITVFGMGIVILCGIYSIHRETMLARENDRKLAIPAFQEK